MKCINKKSILALIIKAQYASDHAKRIKNNVENLPKDFNIEQKYPWWWDNKNFYQLKDRCIENALNLIDHNPPMGVYYYVERKADQNGNPSNIIYFMIREEERWLQISFHNFRRSIRFGWAETKKGFPVHWDKKLGGSRESANYLAKKYFAK